MEYQTTQLLNPPPWNLFWVSGLGFKLAYSLGSIRPATERPKGKEKREREREREKRAREERARERETECVCV